MKIYLLMANCIDVMKNYATKCEHDMLMATMMTMTLKNVMKTWE